MPDPSRVYDYAVDYAIPKAMLMITARAYTCCALYETQYVHRCEIGHPWYSSEFVNKLASPGFPLPNAAALAAPIA